MLFQAVSGDADLAGTTVTTRPPDRARQDGGTGNQINLFLYRTSIDAAWRNQDLPGIRPGESGQPPLPLVLSYLMTAYGEDDDEILAHRLLGVGMQVLNDQPAALPQRHRAALSGSGPGRPARPGPDHPASHPDGRDLPAVGHFQHRLPHLGELRRCRGPDRQHQPVPRPRCRCWPARPATWDRSPAPQVAPFVQAASPPNAPARRPPRRRGDADRPAPGRRVPGPGLRRRAERPAAAAGRPRRPSSAVTVQLPTDSPLPAGHRRRHRPGDGRRRRHAGQQRRSARPRAGAHQHAPRWPRRSPAARQPSRSPARRRCWPPRRSRWSSARSSSPDRPRPAASRARPLSFALQGFTAGSYVVRLRVDGQDSIPVVAGQTSFDPNQSLVLS